MKVEALVEALRELQDRGWPLTVERYPASDDPDFGNTVRLYVGLGKTFFWSEFDFWESDGPNLLDTWALMGWAVSCLEARGLKREVLQYPDGWVCVVVEDGERYEVADIGASTEIEALLKACLALPEEPS